MVTETIYSGFENPCLWLEYGASNIGFNTRLNPEEGLIFSS